MTYDLECMTCDNDTLEQRQPAGVQALQMLLHKLNNGDFKSGQALKESVLAKEFDVSRNAVREALNQIVGWGIFEYVPYCGYRIKEFTSQDVLEWYEMREALEPIAARRLAKARPRDVLAAMEHSIQEQEQAMASGDTRKSNRADLNFHMAVISNCGNRRFSHLQNISYMAASFFFNRLGHLPARYEVAESTIKYLPPDYTQEEFDRKSNELTIIFHRKMLDSIRTGDAQTAEALFKEHAHNQVVNIENMIMYYGHRKLEELLTEKKLILS